MKRVSFAATALRAVSCRTSVCYTILRRSDFIFGHIEFLSHLEYYLKEAKIEFVEHSKYPLGDGLKIKGR